MRLTAKEIAKILNGVVEGDENISISRPAKIEEAQKDSITFLANPKYENFVYTTKAGIILVNKEFYLAKGIAATLIRVENVYAALTQLLKIQEASKHSIVGISSLAFVDKTTKLGQAIRIGDFTSIQANGEIGNDCIIYPQVFIGSDVRIGSNTIIYPGVKIYANCQIGSNCIIHANAIIGSDGFGFAPQKDGTYQKIPQVGIVQIEDDVEIGANTVIDRATMGATVIKKGTKLDNLIQVAHNVTIDTDTVIAAQTGVAGSTYIGKNCQVGGQVGFVGHIKVADGTQIQAQSGVASNIKKNKSKVYGSPAIAYRDYLRAYALFRQLPKLEKRIRDLENKLE